MASIHVDELGKAAGILEIGALRRPDVGDGLRAFDGHGPPDLAKLEDHLVEVARFVGLRPSRPDIMRRHHRTHAVRAHLLEMAGDPEAALPAYREAARLTASQPEQRYLNAQAERLGGEG